MEIMTRDQILSDPKLYEQQDIRGHESLLLGHYWFPTSNLIQETTAVASPKEQGNNKHSNKLLSLNEHQKRLLDDEQIIFRVEDERCRRYGFTFDPSRTKRRRIFFGSTLADDSFFLLQTIATESYDLFHTVSFVESNLTHTRSPRELRFPPNSDELRLLQSMFGRQTRVSVEYFAPRSKLELPDEKEGGFIFSWQHMQRQGILERWKRNGMQPDDIGLLADADEMLTRDFLRALQICQDIKEFEPGQTCEKPKIVATTLIYEASPECIVSSAKLWHPDVILGECLEGIGDDSVHKLALRVFHGNHSMRADGHGRQGYEEHFARYPELGEDKGVKMYPLWNAADYRSLGGGSQIRLNPKVSHNAFHFHNFFESSDEIRHKYTTYGEPLAKAKSHALGMIHDDLSIVVACVHGWQNFGNRKYHLGGHQEVFSALGGPRAPILFQSDNVRNARHQHLKELIQQDEKRFGQVNGTCGSATCTALKKQ